MCVHKQNGRHSAYKFQTFSQVFYRTHIIAFVAFIAFGFMHHYQLWAYTMPGEVHCHHWY